MTMCTHLSTTVKKKRVADDLLCDGCGTLTRGEIRENISSVQGVNISLNRTKRKQQLVQTEQLNINAKIPSVGVIINGLSRSRQTWAASLHLRMSEKRLGESL